MTSAEGAAGAGKKVRIRQRHHFGRTPAWAVDRDFLRTSSPLKDGNGGTGRMKNICVNHRADG